MSGYCHEFGHDGSIFVVCNVTKAQAARHVHEKLSYICSDAWHVTYPRLGADLYDKKPPLPEEVTAGHQPTFIIRDLLWSYSDNARSDEIKCSITAGYKFKITYHRWSNSDDEDRRRSVYDSSDSSDDGDGRIYLRSDSEDDEQRHLGSDVDETTDDTNASLSASAAVRRPERGRGRGRGRW